MQIGMMLLGLRHFGDPIQQLHRLDKVLAIHFPRNRFAVIGQRPIGDRLDVFGRLGGTDRRYAAFAGEAFLFTESLGGRFTHVWVPFVSNFRPADS